MRRFELVRHGHDVRERQQAARGVTFFDAEHGCVGLRAVLTPVKGAELRTRLQQVADDVWRAEHPDRADITGGHGGPSPTNPATTSSPDNQPLPTYPHPHHTRTPRST